MAARTTRRFIASRLAVLAALTACVVNAACGGNAKSPFFGITSPVIILDSNPVADSTSGPLTGAIDVELSAKVSTNGLGTAFHLFLGSTASTPIPSSVTFDEHGRILRLQPTAALTSASTYVVSLADGYPDVLGRPVAGVRFSFTTLTPPPLTLRTRIPDPADGAVPLNFIIRAGLSVPLGAGQLSNITATAKQNGLPLLLAPISYDALSQSIVVSPRPTSIIDTNAAIRIAFSASAATDAFGRSLAGVFGTGWTFTTGLAPDFVAPQLGTTFTATETPAASGSVTVTLPTATDPTWLPAKELRWEATFVHKALATPPGCSDPYDPQLTRVAVTGSATSITVGGLENGNWSVTLTAENGSQRRSLPTAEKDFSITGGAVSFAGNVKTILDARCAFDGCHNGPNSPGFQDLSGGAAAISSYQTASPGKPVSVTPFCLSQSYLYWKLVPGYAIDGGLMPPDYVDTPAISHRETDTVRQWISQGAN